MCGFFGIIKNNKVIDKNHFYFSSKLISHRGPDSNNFYSDDYLNLSFYRLSIRDLSEKGNQPMLSQNKKNLICFNGEIYNANEIKKKYLSNFKLNTSSDTEILLEAFSRHGSKIIKELDGMFTIFIYEIDKKNYFFARDRFGIKQLYYTQINGQLIFSSEIKPIVTYLKKTSLNQIALVDFLIKGFMDHDKTFFKNVKLFPSSSFAFYKNKKILFEKFWELKDKRFKNHDVSYYKKKIRFLFEKSIKKHLISDKKIGSFLSGGTDSTVMMQETLKNINYDLETFSYSFENNFGFDEIEEVKALQKKYNFNNTISKISSSYVKDNFERLIEYVESPITSMRLFGVMKNYETVKKKNLNVILEGHGGDEQFAGYEYNYYFFLLDEFRKSRNSKKFVKNLLFSKYSKSINSKKLLNSLMTITNQGGSTSDGTPFVNLDLFKKDFLNEHLFENYFSDEKQISNLLQNSQYQDIKKIKLPRMLKYTDRLSMNFGIECRVPYLDNELFEFSFYLPNQLKFRNGISRWLFKNTFQEKILLQKNKKSITDPQKNWMKDELKDFFLDNVNSKDFKNSDYFDQKTVKSYYESFLKENKDTSFNLIQILSSHIFLKNFKL